MTGKHFAIKHLEEEATLELVESGAGKWRVRQVFGASNTDVSKQIVAISRTVARMYQTAESRAQTGLSRKSSGPYQSKSSGQTKVNACPAARTTDGRQVTRTVQWGGGIMTDGQDPSVWTAEVAKLIGGLPEDTLC
jgi:hypothetical protein